MSEDIKEEVAANAVGAGGMGADSPGPIQGFDPLLKKIPMLKRKSKDSTKYKKLREIIGGDEK